MRWVALLSVAAACSGSSSKHGDAAIGDAEVAHDAPADAPADALVSNVTHGGMVQASEMGTNLATLFAGFYEVAPSSPGCTWRYSGACTLTACASDAGLTPTSAGDLTFTIGGARTTLTYGATGYTPMQASIPPGTSVMVSGAGDVVPIFDSGELVMPDAVAVTSPSDNATIDHTMALPLAWTPTTGYVYVNLAERTGNGAPYPEIYGKTVRCVLDASTGTGSVPADLIGMLDVGTDNIQLVVAGDVGEGHYVEAYTFTVRAIHYDMVRTLSVQ